MTTIFEDLRMPTPSVDARRDTLLFHAQDAELLDPLVRDNLLDRYADGYLDPVEASKLFTALTDKLRLLTDVKDSRPSWPDVPGDDGLTRDEALAAYADDVEEILLKLVPSPAEYVGSGEVTHSLGDDFVPPKLTPEFMNHLLVKSGHKPLGPGEFTRTSSSGAPA